MHILQPTAFSDQPSDAVADSKSSSATTDELIATQRSFVTDAGEDGSVNTTSLIGARNPLVRLVYLSHRHKARRLRLRCQTEDKCIGIRSFGQRRSPNGRRVGRAKFESLQAVVLSACKYGAWQRLRRARRSWFACSTDRSGKQRSVDVALVSG